MELISLLELLFILLFVSLPIQSVSACIFPTFMQTNGSSRDWRAVIKSQNTEFTLRINVTSNKFKTVSTDNTHTSHNRICLEMFDNDKYLVAHEESGQNTNQYTCIQFIRRSNSVVQLKEASISSSIDRNLCLDSNLELNHWLYIDQRNVIKDAQQCPLQGGFSVRVYDKLASKGVCDGLNGQTRIESECTNGQGLHFYFRDQKCVPSELFMYSSQKTLCLAHWQEREYMFILLRHDLIDVNNMWILRYPTSQGDSFIAHLLMDLGADTYSHVAMSDNYLRLDMVRDTSRPASSLCLDDYEVCSAFQKARLCVSYKMNLTCPRTCEICDETKPVVCNFASKYQAQWYNAADPVNLAVTINSTTLTTYSDQQQSRYHCIRWDREQPSSSRYTRKQMLVKEFKNGCRPRYSCVEFMQQANTVLFFKLSQETVWPFTKTPDQALDCRHFSFTDGTSPTQSLFQTKFLNLVYLRASNSVKCDMPQNITDYFVTLKRGTQCRVSIVYNTTGSSFTLIMPNCPNPGIDTQFTCVDSSRMLPKKDQLVVTRAVSNLDSIHCWVFSKRQENTFYLLSAKECNEAIRKKLNRNRLKYLAVFSPTSEIPTLPNDRNTAPVTVTTTRSVKAITPSDNKVGPATKPTDWPVKDDPGVVVGGGESGEVEDGEQEDDNYEVTVASAAVVGVVFTFAVIQTLCICNT